MGTLSKASICFSNDLLNVFLFDVFFGVPFWINNRPKKLHKGKIKGNPHFLLPKRPPSGPQEVRSRKIRKWIQKWYQVGRRRESRIGLDMIGATRLGGLSLSLSIYIYIYTPPLESSEV